LEYDLVHSFEKRFSDYLNPSPSNHGYHFHLQNREVAFLNLDF
jgi:hypothetical protein